MITIGSENECSYCHWPATQDDTIDLFRNEWLHDSCSERCGYKKCKGCEWTLVEPDVTLEDYLCDWCRTVLALEQETPNG